MQEGVRRCLRGGTGKAPRGHALLVAAFPVTKGVGVQEIKQFICLLYIGEQGVDTSDNSFVCNWFNTPGSKQFDTEIAVGENFVSGANHG